MGQSLLNAQYVCTKLFILFQSLNEDPMVVAKELLQVIKEKEAKAVNGAEGMISQKDNLYLLG